MKHLVFILTLLSVLLTACQEPVKEDVYDSKDQQIDSLAALILVQAEIIDSLSAPPPPPPVVKPKKQTTGKAATLDYFTMASLGTSIDRILTKKGYGKSATAKQKQSAWRDGFRNAGYSWSATLRKYASQGFSSAEKAGIAFLMMPYLFCKQEGTVESTFTKREVSDLQELERMAQ